MASSPAGISTTAPPSKARVTRAGTGARVERTFTRQSDGSACAVSQFTSRADYRPGGASARPDPVIIPDRQLNIGAFMAPPAGRVGNVARGAFRGPAIYNWDFSLFKKFRIRERHEIQFRAEFFNFFNHVNLGAPGLNIQAPNTFGVISTSVQGEAGLPYDGRIIQFALKYQF